MRSSELNISWCSRWDDSSSPMAGSRLVGELASASTIQSPRGAATLRQLPTITTIRANVVAAINGRLTSRPHA